MRSAAPRYGPACMRGQSLVLRLNRVIVIQQNILRTRHKLSAHCTVPTTDTSTPLQLHERFIQHRRFLFSCMAPRTSQPRCVWTNSDDSAMLDHLVEQKKLGNQSDSGWKGIVWSSMAQMFAKMEGQKGAVKAGKKCQDHFSHVSLICLRNTPTLLTGLTSSNLHMYLSKVSAD